MIINSFFRRKDTKIYLIIFSIIFITIFLLNFFIIELFKLKNNTFKDTTFLLLKNKEKIENKLNKDKNLKNVSEILILNDYSKIDLEIIINYDLNGVIIYFDDKLKEDEVLIGLSNYDFINNQDLLEGKENKNIMFNYNNEKISLKIKKVININKLNGIIISKNLFDKLKNNNYIYVSTILNEDKISNLLNKYSVDESSIIYSLNANDALNEKNIKDRIKNMTIMNYILIILFIIITLIVDYNVLYDLKNNMFIEKRLGFNKSQIKKNIFIKLLLLHFISFIISIIISIIIISAINKRVTILLGLYLNYYTLIIILFIIVYNLLLSMIVNNKLWKGGENI